VRDWRIYADLAAVLIKRARRLYSGQLKTSDVDRARRQLRVHHPAFNFFQQRYVKRRAIYHKPDILNEIRLLAAPKIRPTSGLQFWGLIPAYLKLSV
jgi:hypothetical protein